MHVDRLPRRRYVTGERASQPGRELRVVGLPYGLTGGDDVEIDGVPPEGELHPAAGHRLDLRLPRVKNLVDAAAHGVVARRARREGDAVAAFHPAGEPRREIDRHAAAPRLPDRPQSHAACRARLGRHEHLVVAALPPSR
ncbi:MAG: hypothetical protein ACK56I_07855, partial [bacterium]